MLFSSKDFALSEAVRARALGSHFSAISFNFSLSEPKVTCCEIWNSVDQRFSKSQEKPGHRLACSTLFPEKL